MTTAAHYRWQDLLIEEMNPLQFRQYVPGQNVTYARVEMKKGLIVPEHHHFNEQISHVAQGSLRFRIGGREVTVGAGEMIHIPPDVPHWTEALEDAIVFEIFSPARDWTKADDAHLRWAAAKA